MGLALSQLLSWKRRLLADEDTSGGPACCRQEEQEVACLNAGGLTILIHLVSVCMCVSLKVLQSFNANRAHVVIQSIPRFKVVEILQLLVVNPQSQARKVAQIEESF